MQQSMFSIGNNSNIIKQASPSTKFGLKLQNYRKFCQRNLHIYLKNKKSESKGRVNVATPQIEQLQTVFEKPKSDIGNDAEVFSWTKQWYPVQVVIHLDPSRPTGVQLLGKDLVIWRDVDGNWVCFEDQCPHRLVPLSEGRLETDGTLQCSYHGWRFNRKGECVKIPQAEPELEQKLCQKERACAKTFPTQEKHGLLWVWGEAWADAYLESLQKNPVVPHVIQNGNFDEKNWQVRDLPYSHEILLENVIDFAHVTVSHHGSQGSDRNNARPIYYKLDDPMHAQKGFKLYRIFDKKDLDKKSYEKQSSVAFIPPSIIFYNVYRKDHIFNLVTVTTPITKGKCRLFSLKTRKNAAETNKKISKIPIWFYHLQQNRFFQQDNVFLFKQEKITENMPKPITKNYFIPTTSDTSVNFLHKWFQTHGQGGVQFYPEMVPANCTENDLTDTYNAHTKLCTFCMDALKNFQKIQIGSWIACAICATCAICTAFIVAPLQVNVFKLGVVFPPAKFLGFSFFSLLFFGLGLLMNKTVKRFYKTEFCHADN